MTNCVADLSEDGAPVLVNGRLTEKRRGRIPDALVTLSKPVGKRAGRQQYKIRGADSAGNMGGGVTDAYDQVQSRYQSRETVDVVGRIYTAVHQLLAGFRHSLLDGFGMVSVLQIHQC